jgi:hypothetical protein
MMPRLMSRAGAHRINTRGYRLDVLRDSSSINPVQQPS